MTSTAKHAASDTEKALAQKWGKDAIAAGFTALPNAFFRYAKALGLSGTDVLVVLHLASYWWDPKANPWPAKAKLAAAMDVDPRTVQRSIAKMQKKGYVKRIYRKAAVGDNLSNEYDLRGLAKAIDKYAKEELALRAKREAEDKQRKTTPTTFKLIHGDKE